MTIGLDPDQAQHFVGSDLGLNGLLMPFADEQNLSLAGKEFILLIYLYSIYTGTIIS